ncbi:VOC family protein [Salana multivorans]
MSTDLAFGLGMITTDSTDPTPLARWWAELLGGEIAAENDGWFVVVSTPLATLAFQKVDAVTPGKNRIHLDLGVEGGGDEGLEAAVRRVVSSGGSLVAERSEGDFRWVTVADPEGNQFCLAPAADH